MEAVIFRNPAGHALRAEQVDMSEPLSRRPDALGLHPQARPSHDRPAVRHRWHTENSAVTGGDGKVYIRGFRGGYAAALE